MHQKHPPAKIALSAVAGELKTMMVRAMSIKSQRVIFPAACGVNAFAFWSQLIPRLSEA
jgi:hypothetical protein